MSELEEISFLDKWGACKICEGEIPYGHSNRCPLFRARERIRQLRSTLSRIMLERDKWAEGKKSQRAMEDIDEMLCGLDFLQALQQEGDDG